MSEFGPTKAFVSIDLQNDYVHQMRKRWSSEHVEQVLSTIASLQNHARQQGYVMIHIVHIRNPDIRNDPIHTFSSQEAMLEWVSSYKDVCAADGGDSRNSLIHKTVEPQSGEMVFGKHRYNPFNDSENDTSDPKTSRFRKILESLGDPEPYCVGGVLEFCVINTVNQASILGLKPSVITDGVFSINDPEDRDFHYNDMKERGIPLLSAEEFTKE